MHKTHAKRRRDIKNKLMAAICMLLVSSIMMVSTTYAWFTLSTAPEVTGINTAVGANGNLEMALMPENGIAAGAAENFGITSAAGDSMLDQVARNITWGNLVDVSVQNGQDAYGLTKITLLPSKLNAATADDANNPLTLATSMLMTPAYGADGRVSVVKADTVTSTYDAVNENFPQNLEYGVRGVGTASGMTDRQLAYRNTRSAANTAMAQAKTASSTSLNTNGASLANIALAHGVDSSATHTQADVASLQKIVNDLLGIRYEATSEGATHVEVKTVVTEKDENEEDIEVTYVSYHTATSGQTATHKVVETGAGVLDYVETAYKNYIIALGASNASGMTDDEFKTFHSTINSAATVYAAADSLTVQHDAVTALKSQLALLKATRESVEEANEMLDAITDEEGILWSDLSQPLYKLADTDAMEINGIAAKDVKANMSKLVNSVTSQGLNVTIASGGGVYADVADHCGDFSAAITIKKVEYNGMALNNMSAKMQTESAQTTSYLAATGAAVAAAGAPQTANATAQPITDMYGYIIDLAFRTNASESNLLLQVDAANRIYGEDGSEETMGHGSSMTFTRTTTDFTLDQMKSLMSCIRIVFFDPSNSNTVLATAKLDVTNTVDVGGDTVTAKMYIYKVTKGGETVYELAGENETATHVQVISYTTPAEGQTATHIADSAATGGYRPINEGETATHVQVISYAAPAEGQTATHVQKTTTAGETRVDDRVITALTQNTAKAVSVLVYLDGEKITNADVAATAASSMTGTMNLQFASSANLVPMEYTPLMDPNAGKNEENQATTYKVTVPEGVEGATSATNGTAYTFTVADTHDLGTVTVAGTTVVPTNNGSGSYTIPGDKVTGDIVITVTAK